MVSERVQVDGLEDLRATLLAAKHLPPPDQRRVIREEAGASQQQVADVLGVSVGTVSRWESGDRCPTPRHIARYRAVLDMLLEVGADLA